MKISFKLLNGVKSFSLLYSTHNYLALFLNIFVPHTDYNNTLKVMVKNLSHNIFWSSLNLLLDRCSHVSDSLDLLVISLANRWLFLSCHVRKGPESEALLYF